VIDWQEIIKANIDATAATQAGLVSLQSAIATRVPQACSTCDGFPEGCGCPHCPTVGKLLAIGAAVMGARVRDDDGSVQIGPLRLAYAESLLNTLQAVEP
jgi:hypothetical protein